MYSRLEIGHKGFAGRQFVYCKPFKKFHSDLRMDKVLFIPPPPFYTGRRRNFEADLHSCWYGTVVLLFRMTVKSDSGELWNCDCTMIDVLFDLQMPRCACRVLSFVAWMCSLGVPGPWCGHSVYRVRIKCVTCAQGVHLEYVQCVQRALKV